MTQHDDVPGSQLQLIGDILAKLSIPGITAQPTFARTISEPPKTLHFWRCADARVIVRLAEDNNDLHVRAGFEGEKLTSRLMVWRNGSTLMVTLPAMPSEATDPATPSAVDEAQAPPTIVVEVPHGVSIEVSETTGVISTSYNIKWDIAPPQNGVLVVTAPGSAEESALRTQVFSSAS